MGNKDTAYRKAKSPQDARRHPINISQDKWMYVEGSHIYLFYRPAGRGIDVFEISTRTMIAALKRRGLLPKESR